MSILSSITHAIALCAVLLFGASSGAVLAEGSNSPAQGGSATAEQSAMVNINTATAAEIAEGLVNASILTERQTVEIDNETATEQLEEAVAQQAANKDKEEQASDED